MKLNLSCTIRTLDLGEPDAKSLPARGGVDYPAEFRFISFLLFLLNF